MNMQEQTKTNSLELELELDINKYKYLTYKLNGELYGSPLLTIKEVVNISELKSVPYMVDYFMGVMNLRGKIVSVIDLRIKFKISHKPNDNDQVLVFEVESGLIGVIVDSVESVETFLEEDIDQNPQIDTKIDSSYFFGVAKRKNDLINLINLSKCLTVEDMRIIKK